MMCADDQIACPIISGKAAREQWLRAVARAQVYFGVQPPLLYVSADVWQTRFDAAASANDALIDELLDVAD